MVLQLGLLLLLLSWIQPLHTSPWPGWHSEVLSFAALGLLLAQGLWSVWRSKGAKAVLPFPKEGLNKSTDHAPESLIDAKE